MSTGILMSWYEYVVAWKPDYYTENHICPEEDLNNDGDNVRNLVRGLHGDYSCLPFLICQVKHFACQAQMLAQCGHIRKSV